MYVLHTLEHGRRETHEIGKAVKTSEKPATLIRVSCSKRDGLVVGWLQCEWSYLLVFVANPRLCLYACNSVCWHILLSQLFSTSCSVYRDLWRGVPRKFLFYAHERIHCVGDLPLSPVLALTVTMNLPPWRAEIWQHQALLDPECFCCARRVYAWPIWFPVV